MNISKLFLQKSVRLFLIVILLFGGHTRLLAQTISNNQQGTHGGFYYSFWQETPDSASMTLLSNGRYTCRWNNVNNFIAGKGWEIGSPTRVIDFTGSFSGGSNGTLAVYGWTRDPLVEYYVVESHGVWTPPGGVSKGTFASDGGVYQIYQTSRVTFPAIDAFQTYWSVRTTKRSSGTVTFANHVAAWKEKGMMMGSTWDYQIMATEGYQSSGSSDITVSERMVTDVTGTSLAESRGFDSHPNPVADKLTVYLPGPQAELSIYTGKGTKVMHWHTEGEVIELDLTELGAGIYLLKIEAEGQTFAKKLVVL